MKLFLSLFLIFILSQCSLNKVVLHHGVHNLDKKQTKLKINDTNINDILRLIGPPSTKSTFDNDVYIYIERKTSSSKLTKLGKKVLLKNNVLVLEINNKGLLVKKDFYDINDMKSVKFDETITVVNYSKKSFIYNFLSTLRQKIDDPLGKKRIKN
jgi:outer membrane protein assembly factor BamE (lipoprotein component of BamABCDE complex)|tara:strand:- start:642 stop:1106 length:465 start_codon:yes stop_codon:yes gene_type:complete